MKRNIIWHSGIALYWATHLTASTSSQLENELFSAAETGDTQVIQRLLTQGADPNAKQDFSEETALMIAADKGNIEPVRTLIESGANLNLKNVAGRTALDYAAAAGQINVLKALANAGADIDVAVGWQKKTPLQKALENKKWAVARALLELGARPIKATALQGLTDTEQAKIRLFQENILKNIREVIGTFLDKEATAVTPLGIPNDLRRLISRDFTGIAEE